MTPPAPLLHRSVLRALEYAAEHGSSHDDRLEAREKLLAYAQEMARNAARELQTALDRSSL